VEIGEKNGIAGLCRRARIDPLSELAFYARSSGSRLTSIGYYGAYGGRTGGGTVGSRVNTSSKEQATNCSP